MSGHVTEREPAESMVTIRVSARIWKHWYETGELVEDRSPLGLVGYSVDEGGNLEVVWADDPDMCEEAAIDYEEIDAAISAFLKHGWTTETRVRAVGDL